MVNVEDRAAHGRMASITIAFGNAVNLCALVDGGWYVAFSLFL